MTPSQLRLRKLHDHIAARLAREIVSGRLPAGAPLPSEGDLVANYGISKTVVRETVQALAFAGLVRIQHGKRTVVLPETERDILSPLVQEGFRAEGLAAELVAELYEVRLLLEPQAARWTAARATCTQLGEIHSLLEAMGAAIGDVSTFLDYDRAFHFAIGTAASNRVLRAILRDIHELLSTSWSLSELGTDELETIFRQHTRIAEAIAARDEAAAEQAMIDHLTWAVRTDRLTKRWRRIRGARAVSSRT